MNQEKFERAQSPTVHSTRQKPLNQVAIAFTSKLSRCSNLVMILLIALSAKQHYSFEP
jgi:hypothetical protein